MAEKTIRDPEPAAQTNLGEAPHGGGEASFAGALVPPYAERQQSMGVGHDDAMKHAFTADAAQVGPGREISQTERQGTSPVDTTAEAPLGVGVSTTPQGNVQALSESEEDRRKDREEAGSSPGQPADPSIMPNLRPGDQAG